MVAHLNFMPKMFNTIVVLNVLLTQHWLFLNHIRLICSLSYKETFFFFLSLSPPAVSWWVILIIFIGFAAGLAFLIYICKRHQRSRVRVHVNPGQPKQTRPIPLRPQPPGQYPLHQYPNNAWSTTGFTATHSYPPPSMPGQISTISYPQGPPPSYQTAQGPGFADPLPPPYPAYGCPTAPAPMPEPTHPTRRSSVRSGATAQPSAPNLE